MPRSALGTNLLLAAGSLCFLALALAGVEVVLRVAGIGGPDASRTSVLKYQQVYLPLLEPATRPDGVAIHRTVDPRLPYQTILRDKPADSLRVFIFGGSAAAGLGFSPNVTFAHHVDRMLRAAYPDRTVEVVNLGIVALASKQVKVMVEHVCAEFAPDLVVVYSGNNEFLEIHAQKYAAAHSSLLDRAGALLSGLHLQRVLARAVGRGRASPSLARQDLSTEDLRLTQSQIIEDVSLTPDEVAQVVDDYQANIEAMARSATSRGIPIILMSVASNWEWRSRTDLPDDWLDELLGSEGAPSPERWEAAIRVLDERIARDTEDRHEWLFRRALAHRALGDADAAGRDFRAAMNADPHLRRALDTANERVARVAAREDAAYLDTVAALAQRAPDGIVGFDEFYDYVHFTPRGVVLVAAEVVREILRTVPPAGGAGYDPEGYVKRQLASLESRDQDSLAVDDWLGFGFDRSGIADRDLWKYDKFIAELDARLARDPTDVTALVYRGNAAYFRVDGAAQAAADYRAALEAGGEMPEVRANLDALLRERGP